jgi:MFS transporter, DHA1 family, multidrug resistance protein B
MKFSEFHRTIQLRIGLAFGTSLMNNLTTPFMAIYFASKLGMTFAGMATILFILVGAFSGFVGGYYADRIGRKKLVLLAEAMWALSCLVIALANSPWYTSPAVTFLMTLVINFCWGIHGPAVDGMMLDALKPEERKYMYGMMYWANNLSIALAGVVGAYLFKDYLFGLFLAEAAMVAVSWLIMYLFIDDSYQAKSVPSAKSAGLRLWDNYKKVFQDKTFIIFIAASMLIMSVEFHLGNYIGIRLEKEVAEANIFNWGAWSYQVNGIQLLGLLRTENTILVVLLSFLMRTLMQRFPEKPLLMGGFLVYVLFYSLIAYSDHPWVLFGAMVIATFGELLYVPIKQAYLGFIVPEHARGSYMAMYSLTWRGALLIAGGGIMLGGWLPAWMMASNILITGLTGIALFYLILPRMEAKRVEPASSASASASAEAVSA